MRAPTDLELQALDALESEGTYTAAAQKLGISSEALRSRVRSARKNALVGLQVPRGPQVGAPKDKYVIPEGLELRSRSTFTEAGNEKAAWDKASVAAAEPLIDPMPPGFAIRKVSSYMGADAVVRGQHITVEPGRVEQWNAWQSACKDHAEQYARAAALAPPAPRTDTDLLQVYPLGDPHIGMLAWAPETGEHFDLNIARRDLLTCIDLLVSQAPTAETALLINLGDFFHAQDDTQLTPRGHNKLDHDGRHAKVYRLGLEMFTHMIDRLLGQHRTVRVYNIPGNHDPRMAVQIATHLEAFYRAEPRVQVVDAFNPYQFYQFGSTLLGMAHGDGAKMDALPLLMATEQAKAWGETRFHHWLTGHVHHQIRKEHAGCVVESFRTLAGKDYWHHASGYRAGRSLHGITVHKRFGEVNRSTVDLSLVRYEQSISNETEST